MHVNPRYAMGTSQASRQGSNVALQYVRPPAYLLTISIVVQFLLLKVVMVDSF